MSSQSTPLRVLHIIDTNGLGGAQSLLSGFVGHPGSETRHRIFALREHRQRLLEESEHVETYHSDSRYSLGPIGRLRVKLREESIDIVHCHLPRSLATGWLLRFRSARNICFVAHEHGQILGSNDHSFLTDFAYCSLKRLTRSAFDFHISVSNATRAALTERVGVQPDEISVISSFVDTARYNTASRWERRDRVRADLQLADSDVVVGIAGRMTAKKGWRVFMEALQKFGNDDRAPVAVVTGDGPDRPEFERIAAELRSQIRIHDLRWVDDIRDFYALLDIFVAPSFAEGSPVAVREAMAMGLPIVSSDAEGFLDVIEHEANGLVFPVGDAELLHAQIRHLLSDAPLAVRIGRNAAEKAREFSLEYYLSALDDVYFRCRGAGAAT